mmetsp:Transcript_15660/g.22288  ORF Transcript_15660/g.22288 Transcript_15660/m.22288 type:complete len:172 (+) Transcript_15660:377-892(+)
MNKTVIMIFDSYFHDVNIDDTINFKVTPTTDVNHAIAFDGFSAQLSDTWMFTKMLFKIVSMNLAPEDAKNSLFADIAANVTSFTVVKSTHIATLPTLVTPGSAGHDIMAAKDATIDPYSSKSVPIGLKMNLPKHLYAEIKSRSGLAKRYNITAHNGVINSYFRGEESSHTC